MNPRVSKSNPQTRLSALALMLALAGAAHAAGSTKDIVIDRVQAPLLAQAGAPVSTRQVSDAMAVSVLVESPDGTLTPRGTAASFRTGERFRVKIIAARDGRVALYNTRPDGVTLREPVWSGPVKAGEELITQRLLLEGQSGSDQLHIVLEPIQTAGVWDWLRRALGLNDKGVADKSATKDIVLDTQATPTGTYVSNLRGDGLSTTITINHNR